MWVYQKSENTLLALPDPDILERPYIYRHMAIMTEDSFEML